MASSTGSVPRSIPVVGWLLDVAENMATLYDEASMALPTQHPDSASPSEGPDSASPSQGRTQLRYHRVDKDHHDGFQFIGTIELWMKPAETVDGEMTPRVFQARTRPSTFVGRSGRVWRLVTWLERWLHLGPLDEDSRQALFDV